MVDRILENLDDFTLIKNFENNAGEAGITWFSPTVELKLVI